MLRRQFFGAGLFALLGFGILGGGGTAMAEDKAYMPIWTNGTPGTIVVTDPKYGAYGDGVHDDWAAIQAAIDDAGAAGGGSVILSSNAKFLISASLTFNNPGVSLGGSAPATLRYGESAGVATIVPNGNFSVFVINNAAHNTRLHDMNILPNATPTSGWVIEAIGSSGTYLNGPVIENVLADGVYGGMSWSYVQGAIVKNLTLQGTNGPTGFSASDCTLCSLSDVIVAQGAAGDAYSWTNCSSFYSFNLAADGSNSVVTSGMVLNTQTDSDFYSLQLNGTSGTQLVLQDCADVRFHQPYIYDGLSHGINIVDSGHVSVTGGYLLDNDGSAVLVNTSSGNSGDVNITGAEINGKGTAADALIATSGNVYHFNVTGCILNGGGVKDYCISDQSTYSPPNNSFVGNTCVNYATKGITIGYNWNVSVVGNQGHNPVGFLTPAASPYPSGTAYQNTYGVDITIYQPAYATASGTAGTVQVGLAASGSSTTNVFTQQISGSSTSTAPDIVTIRVPAGWTFKFTATGATLANATIQGE